MAHPAIIPERKALVDLMNEILAIKRKTPNRSQAVNNAFDNIYWYIDRQLELMPCI